MGVLAGNAYAETTSTQAVIPSTEASKSDLMTEEQPSVIGSMLPLVVIFVIFYFMMIRPQQKRIKEHQALLSDIKKGDKIVTGGGVIGTVYKVEDEDVVTVEIAPDVRVKVSRPTISSVMGKTVKPANDADANSQKKISENKSKAANNDNV